MDIVSSSAPPLVLPGSAATVPRRARTSQDRTNSIVYGAAPLLVGGLVLAGYFAPTAEGPIVRPLVEFGKLVAAAAIGLLVTTVSRTLPGEKAPTAAMQQAQVMLCVAGVVMMLIIGDSLARAFGVLGAASIIRFRTPVKDPRSVTILFLLMGLGMAVGLGAYSLAGVGAGFLCVCLPLIARANAGDRSPRAILLKLTSAGPDFPGRHVADTLGRAGATFEPREVLRGDEVVSLYQVLLPPGASLDQLTRELVDGGGAGLKAVNWESPKKGS